MNVLQLVQEFCGKKTLPVPSIFVGNPDFGVTQIFYLLQEELRELGKYSWNAQKASKTFTTVAAKNQGALTTLIGADFSSLISATLQNLTSGQPLSGPTGDTSWSQLQTFPSTGTFYQFKVFGGNLHISPAPPAGETVYLIYQSKYPVASSLGVAKEFITVDTDIFLLPEEVVTRGLDYRWKRQKGEPWEADYVEYNDLKGKAMMATGAPVYRLDDCRGGAKPGILIPAGSW